MERLINADGLDVVQAIFTDITQMHLLQEAQEQEQRIENQSLRAATCTAYPLIMSINLTKIHTTVSLRNRSVLMREAGSMMNC